MPHATVAPRPGRGPAAALLLALVLAPCAAAPPAAADEGMWLLNDFPEALLAERYGFTLSPAWLDHVREAAVRFNNGGSGSFVSPDGLVITNHHVGRDCIQKLSTAEHDAVAAGFVAAGREDERACPDLELNVLDSIERVTERVRGAVRPGTSPEEAAAARRAATAGIEAECHQATGLRCDVVTLYEGGEYDLYRYRRYTDVRLVFAPEAQLASFGGDPDNFEYPRFDLDVSLFRVYRDGRPLHPASYLPFDPSGPEQGSVVFVAGNPGSTGRLSTLAQLAWLRDVAYPFRQTALEARHAELATFAARGAEQARISRGAQLGVENSLKAIGGYLAGLLDEGVMAEKERQEQALRRRVAADPELAAEIGDPWGEIAAALDLHRTVFAREQAFAALDRLRLPSIAQRIVRLAAERDKPNGERLAPYRESALPSLYQRLYSPAPIYPEYEEFLLAGALRNLYFQLGPTHPLVLALLGDRGPEEVAHDAVAGTRLGDVAFRQQLVAGGSAAVAASDDPLLVLMRRIEPYDREIDDLVRERVESVEESAGARIARVWFQLHQRDTYPDATFTLRLSFGVVEGYDVEAGTIPWVTTFGGLFHRAERFGGRPPFDVPPRLAAARGAVDPSTPLDFVSTNDIIGGNSGSPVIDREGRFVGIIFDGNLWMLPNRFVYSDARARAVSVDARGILAALTEVYPARHVADELLAGAREAAGGGK